MNFGCMVTFGDHTLEYGTWSKVGVWHILARLKECGITRVYWRGSGSGQAAYRSRIKECGNHIFTEDFPEKFKDRKEMVDYVNATMSYAEFDAFGCARQRCRDLGLDFIAWHESRAEDHNCALHSQFVKKYPQFLSIRDDGQRAYSELGWAFPEVMDRRIELFREIIGYEPDGLYFDFHKSGDNIVNRHGKDGYWRMGYEKPMIDGFRNKTGRDPKNIPNTDKEWLAYRAEYVTEYLRRCRKIRDTLYPKVKLGVFAMQPKYAAVFVEPTVELGTGKVKEYRQAFYPDDPLANLEDHRTWISEELVDAYTISHSTRFDPDTFAEQIRMAKSRLKDAVLLKFEIGMATPAARDFAAWLKPFVELAEREGIDELIFRESCPMWPYTSIWEYLKKLIPRHND